MSGLGDAWEDTTMHHCAGLWLRRNQKRRKRRNYPKVAKRDLLPMLVADCLIVTRVFSSPQTMDSKSKDSFSTRSLFVSGFLYWKASAPYSQEREEKRQESLLGRTKHAKKNVIPTCRLRERKFWRHGKNGREGQNCKCVSEESGIGLGPLANACHKQLATSC